METSLHGRRALITGAASGIGAAIAEAFAREGAHVAVHARSEERADPTVDAIEAAGGRAFAAVADLRDRAAIARMCETAIERLGGLDILVNNAGFFAIKPVAEMDLASWDGMVETNLTAPYLATQAALPALRASGVGASVIFVSSIAAGAYSAGWGTYAMTKNGLNAFMRCLADEVGGDGVRVNSISPGWVETKMAQDAHRGLADRSRRRLRRPLRGKHARQHAGRAGDHRLHCRHGRVPRERARPSHHGAGAHGLRRLPSRQQR